MTPPRFPHNATHPLGKDSLPLVVEVSGGTFEMGSSDIHEAEAANPPHRIRLPSFWLGVHPVTNAQYRAFVEATGHRPPASWTERRFDHAEQPVVCVDWHDANAYCQWAGGSLPTEAQWEYAARGDDGRRYPWGDDAPDGARAHFAQDWNSGGPSIVGAHPLGASRFGCEDMSGNVWEWCLDEWRVDAHLVRAGVQPVRAATDVRPLRGGCWRSIDCKLQATYRNWFHRKASHVTMGFRFCTEDCRCLMN